MNFEHSLSVAVRKANTPLRILGVILLGILIFIGVVSTLLVWLPVDVSADGPDQADIVIQFGENDMIVRRITFTAPISGYEALRLTGLNIISDSTPFGIAICDIEGIGDTAASCFSSGFWSSYFWNGSDWESYLVGASSSIINDGAVELWSWEEGFVPLDPLPSQPQLVSASNALAWLRSQQLSDGSYGSTGSTAEAVAAFGANKLGSAAGGVGHLLGAGAAFSGDGPAESGKLALALSSAGACLPAGMIEPMGYYSSTTGAFSTDSGRQAWAMLGTYALSQTVPGAATSYLKGLFQADGGSGGGGWEWEPTFGLDTNTTALAIQALVAGGEDPGSSTVIKDGLVYLKSAQNSDGGFAYDPNSSISTDSDTNSTAYVVQALLAAGEDPTTSAWTINDTNPISFLVNMQLSDGSIEWQPGAAFGRQSATQQAIPALLGRSHPVSIADLDSCQAFYLPVVFKD